MLQNLSLSVSDLIALFTGICGTVLGITNLWRDLNNKKVKLKVIPQFVIPIGGPPSSANFSIEVVNFSAFPVVITSLGFLLHGTTHHLCLMNYFLTDGQRLPKRLEPRTAVTAYFDATQIGSENAPLLKCAYAKTACGTSATGMNQALKNLKKRI